MIGIILVLRNNLKSLYSIGEDKITKFTNAATNGRKIIPEFTKAVTRRIADVETGSRNGAKTGGDLIMDYSDLRLGLVQEIATVDQWLEARQNVSPSIATDDKRVTILTLSLFPSSCNWSRLTERLMRLRKKRMMTTRNNDVERATTSLIDE